MFLQQYRSFAHKELRVCTVRSRYKRQLIRLNMKEKWPTRTGMEDSRPIFFCKRFSYNENALYIEQSHGKAVCHEAPVVVELVFQCGRRRCHQHAPAATPGCACSRSTATAGCAVGASCMASLRARGERAEFYIFSCEPRPTGRRKRGTVVPITSSKGPSQGRLARHPLWLGVRRVVVTSTGKSRQETSRALPASCGIGGGG